MLEIKDAEQNDVSAITDILKLSFRESFEKYAFCPAYEANTDQIISWMGNDHLDIIVHNGELVGSIFIRKINHNTYELNTITVHPIYQNQGVGAKAIELMERKYSDAAIWILSTPELDLRNRHLYEKIGYEEIGKQRVNKELVLIEYRKEIREFK